MNAAASSSDAFIIRDTQLPIDSNQNKAKVAMLAIYLDLKTLKTKISVR